MMDPVEEEHMDGVAVIGLAGRVPGACSVEQLWENLKAGRESIQVFSDEELAAAGVPRQLISDPSYVKARGLLDSPHMFDATFFGISPHEAELMDPQHRLFLETCWHALEDAGYAPSSIGVSVGVWGGQSTGMANDTYLHSNLKGPRGVAEEDALSVLLGNENDYLTTRVSHKLNLRGPSVNIQTACSTSLVAIVQAYQSLMTYGCDMAIAGGISVSYPQVAGYHYQEGAIGSPDGHCRPFDARAQGTVFSNGVGAVVLKRLHEAMADGDRILAVVRGAAINNDGASKVSFAAPSVQGQAEVIATAQALAGVNPEGITFVEAHGTGTPIGDPIEVEALTSAFRRKTSQTGFCALGSIKSNFGHLDSAAGVVGFIKTVLCLHHRTLVPTVHFRHPSPKIDWDNSPFFVNVDTRFWETDRLPRRAGVSSFGIGGTNAHVVLEEAPSQAPVSHLSEEGLEILPLSARCPEALHELMTNLGGYLKRADRARLCDIANTLQVGREAFLHRAALIVSDTEEAAGILLQGDRTRIMVGEAIGRAGGFVFLFPGGGAQYINMGRGLYETFSTFRDEVDRGMDLLRTREGLDLKPIWFPKPGEEEPATAAFQRPSVQLPAVFILEMALARLLVGWGFEPAALIGHSMGENTAACLADVLSYEDALGLVALRGRLFDTAAPGGMLSVGCPADELAPYLRPDLDLAAVNGPAQCTVSGPKQAVADLRRDLDLAGIEAQIVPIDIAAHSSLVEPLLEPFEAYLRSIKLRPPKIPFLSNRTGTWITDEEATDPSYWASHLRGTVLFADNVRTVLEEGRKFFLEVGPGRVLSSLVKLADPGSAPLVSAMLRHPAEEAEDVRTLMSAIARMWVSGSAVDWHRLRGTQEVRRVSLPGYPFQRRPFLIEPMKNTGEEKRSLVGPSVDSVAEEASTKEVPAVDADRDPAAILRQIVDLQARTNAAIQAYVRAAAVQGKLRSAPEQQLKQVSQLRTPAPAGSSVGATDSRSPDAEQCLAFWKERLSPPLPVLDFMPDRSHAGGHGNLRSSLYADLEPSVMKEVESLARQEKATQIHIFLAAYLAVLHRMTGDEDLIVGVPGAVLATGDQPALANGPEGTVPFRAKVEPRASFRHLVRQVRDLSREAWRHRDTDWEVLLGTLGPPDDRRSTTLYQTRFSAGVEPDRMFLPGPPREDAIRTDFDLCVETSSEEPRVKLEYAADRIEPETMVQLASHFREVLRIAVQDPEAPVRSLPAAGPGVMERLADWNDTALALPQVESLADWLSEEWVSCGERVALVAEDRCLTFAELDERSNRLAQHLLDSGVLPGSLVGISLERTSDLVVAAVAVWKSGAGYVPLDPAYPSARLEFMAQRADLRLIITTGELEGRFGRYSGRSVLLDVDRQTIERCSAARLRLEADLSDPAYVIFTSGSTGEPKGVKVPARAVINFLESMGRRPGFASSDVLLAVTTLSFDISVLELFLPLRSGGTVVLASAADAMDGMALVRMIEEHDVPVLQGTPGTWRLLCGSGWAGRSTLRALCGGEGFPRDLLRELLPRVGQVWNMYGPTETTVWSTCAQLTDADAPITIGSPIHNTRCYVLDSDGRPVPPGIPGELYIGGLGVADGYLGRPEENARRFVPDPVTPGGGLIYRTGDMVRWRRDGSLEHLHRVDQQVKLRGFRIELGEIEATLNAIEGVRGAAVVLAELHDGPELVAYVAADPGALTDRGLRERAAQSLPSYMVPRILIRIDDMPMTENGKIDRKALPDPGADPGWGSSAGLAAPETDAERYLAAIWQEILDITAVSVEDNFFDLGGHSLLAVRTIARIREERGVEVPFQALIAGTLGMIAERYVRLAESRNGPEEDRERKSRTGGVLDSVRNWISR